MLEELDHECRENDANVSIKDEDEIEELFHDCLDSFITNIEENLRFRNDIEIVKDYDMNAGTVGSILLIKSYIDDTEINLEYEMSLNPDEGADSTLRIYSESKQFSTELTYTNGAVEYDYDSGLYIPITQDELESVDGVVDEVIELIDGEMPDYKEITDEDDIAGYAFCYECGEETICINEDVLPLGTCINCGYVNEMHECEECGSWFNSDEDGLYEDGVAICQSCLEYLEE